MSIRSAIGVPFMSVGWRLFIWIPLNGSPAGTLDRAVYLTSLNYNGGLVGDCSQLLRFRIIVHWSGRRGGGSRFPAILGWPLLRAAVYISSLSSTDNARLSFR